MNKKMIKEFREVLHSIPFCTSVIYKEEGEKTSLEFPSYDEHNNFDRSLIITFTYNKVTVSQCWMEYDGSFNSAIEASFKYDLMKLIKKDFISIIFKWVYCEELYNATKQEYIEDEAFSDIYWNYSVRYNLDRIPLESLIQAAPDVANIRTKGSKKKKALHYTTEFLPWYVYNEDIYSYV